MIMPAYQELGRRQDRARRACGVVDYTHFGLLEIPRNKHQILLDNIKAAQDRRLHEQAVGSSTAALSIPLKPSLTIGFAHRRGSSSVFTTAWSGEMWTDAVVQACTSWPWERPPLSQLGAFL